MSEVQFQHARKVGNAWGLSEWYPNRPKPQPKAKGQPSAPESENADDEAPE
jgi:hypothetical protein